MIEDGYQDSIFFNLNQSLPGFSQFIIAFLFLSRFDTLPLLQAKSYKDYALKVTEYRNLKYRQYTTRSLSKTLQIQQTTAEVVLSS